MGLNPADEVEHRPRPHPHVATIVVTCPMMGTTSVARVADTQLAGAMLRQYLDDTLGTPSDLRP